MQTEIYVMISHHTEAAEDVVDAVRKILTDQLNGVREVKELTPKLLNELLEED